MGESKRPNKSSKRPPRMPGPPPLPATGAGATSPTGAMASTSPKRINLRDLRKDAPRPSPGGPAPALALRRPSNRPPAASPADELGEALIRAKRNEERAVIAESERDAARIETHAARQELGSMQKRIARLEAELALIRSTGDSRKSSEEIRAQLGPMLQGIADLRNALIQAATDLETLHERELETAELRDRILTGAASLLVKAVGQAQAQAGTAPRVATAAPASRKPVPESSPPLTFAKSAAALILPPETKDSRAPSSSSADIPVTVDISEVQELIESLLPPKP